MVYTLAKECHAQLTLGRTGFGEGESWVHWGIWNGMESNSSSASQVLEGKEQNDRIREAGDTNHLLQLMFSKEDF